VANPFSNVFQKLLTRRAANPLFIICATHALLSLAVAPILLLLLPPLSPEFWRDISICTLLNVAGNALLVQAVKLSDLSVLGPINAYKAIVSLLPGMILLHEIPGLAGLSGMLLILAGTYFLVEQDADQPCRNVLARLFQDRGVRYRFAALILSASEAIFLKKALLASSPLTTFALWSLLGFGASLAAVAVSLKTERIRQELRVMQASKLTYLSLFATTGLMQFSTIVALEQFQVGYALALFQTSSLVSVALGHRFFQERDFGRRLAGSLVMVAGAVLIVVAR
jgi:drug/metabolite transporter (DMT)-like permease